jgi:predicted ABC-type ATPase
MFTPDEQRIADEAVVFAKANRKEIASRWTDLETYKQDDVPVSIFMAGSPGAGKTEASLEFLGRFDAGSIRIDPDLLRSEFATYTGANSYLFQRAISVLVERIHKQALKQRQSFLLDGTSSNYDVVARNIRKSLKLGRFVLVLYVYQKPEWAWRFVCARERVEGRNIPRSEFARQYFSARDAINRLKENFGHAVTVDILIKSESGSTRFYKENIQRVDDHIRETYDPDSLERMLETIGNEVHD